MPFDDVLDLNDDLTLSDLEKLDRQASKTENNLEKLKRKGGIFAESTSNTTTGSRAAVNFEGSTGLSKQDKKIEKRMERLLKKVRKDEVKNIGKDKQGLANQIFGDNVGKTLFSFGKNPQGFIKSAALGLGAFAGAGFALEIADKVIKEIQRIDAFFKIFIDRIDDRVDALRSRQQQAEIAAGLTQLIITTESGNTSARDAYNTFNEFNNNRSKLEEDFATQNTSGYD